MAKKAIKKMNHKSGLTYIVKGYYNSMLNVYKLHISDDDCNEFTAVVFGNERLIKGWHDADFLQNCIYTEYNAAEWVYMKDEEGYSHTISI